MQTRNKNFRKPTLNAEKRRALLLSMTEEALKIFLISVDSLELRKFSEAFFCRRGLEGEERDKKTLVKIIIGGVVIWKASSDHRLKRAKAAKRKHKSRQESIASEASIHSTTGRDDDDANDRGYKYFGAAKDLPGVMEPFEQSKELEQMRQSRAELMRSEEEEVETARFSCFVEEESNLPILQELELKETTEQINEIRDLHAADLTEDVKQKLYLTGIRPPLPKKKEKDEFPELPTEALILCQRAWGCGPSDEVFCQGFDAKITRKDLATLKPCKWLNDEVINFFLNLICTRSKIDESLPKVYTFNTFFFVNISTKGYNSVRRWTRNVDIFSFDILLVPVHVSGVHWCMAVVDFGKKSIEYFDPMHHSDNGTLSFIQQYLKDESKDKKKKDFDFTGWSFKERLDCPRQQNGHDCGVFSTHFAEYCARRAQLTFSQHHMDYFRKRMAWQRKEDGKRKSRKMREIFSRWLRGNDLKQLHKQRGINKLFIAEKINQKRRNSRRYNDFVN